MFVTENTTSPRLVVTNDHDSEIHVEPKVTKHFFFFQVYHPNGIFKMAIRVANTLSSKHHPIHPR